MDNIFVQKGNATVLEPELDCLLNRKKVWFLWYLLYYQNIPYVPRSIELGIRELIFEVKVSYLDHLSSVV